MKKKLKIKVAIGLALLTILCLFPAFYKNDEYQINILDYETKWINKDLEIKIDHVEGAKYSFNNSEYSDKNNYIIDTNIDTLEIKVKYKNKEYTKKIKIDNIDKTGPIIKNASIKNNILTIDATDEISGIKEYVFIIDDKEYRTSENNYEIKKYKKLIIKVIDNASNETVITEEYFNEDKITYNLNTNEWTKDNVIITINKKDNYLSYSFSSKKDDENYQDANTFEVDENKNIYVKVKTDKKILEKTIEIKNIDRKKPQVKYEIKNDTVIINATDNSNDKLLYSWNGGKYSDNNIKKYSDSINNQVVKVKDIAGNIEIIKFNVNISKNNSNSNISENKNQEVTNNKNNNSINNDNNKNSNTQNKNDNTQNNNTNNKNNNNQNNNNQNQSTVIKFNIRYSETASTINPVVVTIDTDNGNLISFDNGDWSSTNSKSFKNNVSNYSVRIKDKNGKIHEKFINISNIREETFEEKNKKIIDDIYNKYGFKISYGEGTYGYYGGACTVLYDHQKANTALNELYPILSHFPSGFFRQFQGVNGYRVILFESIPNGASGVATYEIGNDNQMYLNTTNKYLLDRTFYHETFHLMERYMMIKNNWVSPFDSFWDNLNPSGFTYGDSSNNNFTAYDTIGTQPEDISFISAYAKTNPREDRAELFADLMFRYYKKNYMAAGYGINEKAKALALEIRKYFSGSTGAYWEKYITW